MIPSRELEAFVEYLVLIKGLAPLSIEAYRHDLLALECAYGQGVATLTLTQVWEWMGRFDNPRTLNRRLSAYNHFITFCQRRDFVHTGERIQLRKLPSTLPTYLSYEEIFHALEQIPRDHWLRWRDYALILFLYATGLRVSECLGIDWRDIEETWVRVRHAKGSKERMVPIAPEALRILREYRERIAHHAAIPVWINHRGKRLSRISAFAITRKYLGVSPHALRHSYATALVLGGADIRVVQELLGHASLLSTQIYTHIEPHHLRQSLLQHHPMARADDLV